MSVGSIQEADLYTPVKLVLEKFGWDVYTEVIGRYGTKRADIVATKGEQTAVIELKKTLSIQLMEQAIAWKGKADYIFVAVPKSKNRKRSGWLASKILDDYNIGYLEVDLELFQTGEQQGLTEDWRKLPDKLEWSRLTGDYGVTCISYHLQEIKFQNFFPLLTEEHKTWSKAGIKGGGYVTSYALLMRDVYEYLLQCDIKLKGEGWKTASEIWKHLKTHSKEHVINHYRNPVPGITQALKIFERDYIEMKKINNRLYFRLTEIDYERKYK